MLSIHRIHYSLLAGIGLLTAPAPSHSQEPKILPPAPGGPTSPRFDIDPFSSESRRQMILDLDRSLGGNESSAKRKFRKSFANLDIQIASVMINKNPNDPNPYFMRIEAFLRVGRHGAAEQDLQKLGNLQLTQAQANRREMLIQIICAKEAARHHQKLGNQK